MDVTDDVHPFYKEIAQQAAKAACAKVCGVDMIVPDHKKEGDYSIIELNFNPVLYIHNYPYHGKIRQVGEKILNLLGF